MPSILELPRLRLVVLLLASLTTADVFSDDYNKYNDAEYGKQPTQSFVSNPHIIAPLLQVNVWDKDRISPTGGSHIFLRHDFGHASPLILDADDLSVVYMDRSHNRISDIRAQKMGNETFVTYYSGSIVDGHGVGDGIVLDSSYNEAFKVNARDLGVRNDLHEFQFTEEGTALITVYPQIRTDLRKFRGTRQGYLLDGVFQEVNIVTGEVLFTWRASDHIDLSDSFYRVGHKWDFFHINSIEKSRDGNYLVSARHMHSIYLIDGHTGDIIWTLGGKKNQFKELPAPDRVHSSGDGLLSFSWQHHARFVPGTDETEITLFDNHALSVTTDHSCTKHCSRGLRIRLALDDTQTPTAQILQEFVHPQSVSAQSQGSVQTLDDGSGHVFIGWGRCPSFTEHAPDGEAVMDVQFSPWHTKGNRIALDNYRTYRMDWKATPHWDPDVMVANGRVYASWNGATEVKAWAFLALNESADLYGPDSVVGIVPRTGFETSLALPFPALFVRAAALDAAWNVLGSSGIVDVAANATVFADARPVVSVQEAAGTVVGAAALVDAAETDEAVQEAPQEEVVNEKVGVIDLVAGQEEKGAEALEGYADYVASMPQVYSGERGLLAWPVAIGVAILVALWMVSRAGGDGRLR